MSSGRLQNTLIQTAIYAVGIGASKGVALLLVPLYTRQMPASDIAIWDLCTTTVLFVVAIAEVGMASALARFYIQADDDAERLAVSRTAMAIVLLTAVITIGCAWGLRETAAVSILGDASLGELVLLLGIVAALTVVSNQPLAQLRAQERSIAFSVLNLARAVIGPATIVYMVVVRDRGVSGILIGEAAGLAAMGAAGLLLSGRYAVPAVDPAALRKLLSFGIPIVPIGLSTAIILVSDRYFLRAYVGLDELAVYTVGFKIATIMSLAAQALQTAWAPSAFRIAKQPDAAETLARSFRILLFGTCSLALALSTVAPELVRIIAPGAAYDGAERVVPLIAFSYAAQAGLLIMAANLVISNRTIFATILFCAGAAVKLLLNATLIPVFGIEGAASATLASFILQLVLCYFLTRMVYPVPYELDRLAALAGALAVAATLSMASFNQPWYLGLPIRILLLALFLAFCGWVGVIPRSAWALGRRLAFARTRLNSGTHD